MLGNIRLLEGWVTEFDFDGWVARTMSAVMTSATKQTLAWGTSWVLGLITKMKKMAVKLLVNNSIKLNCNVCVVKAILGTKRESL